MKTIEVKILETKLKAPLLNHKVARSYEEGLGRVAEIAAQSTACSSRAEAIENMCNAVIGFVDEIFGEGSSEKVFGEETDLQTCLEAWRDITSVYERYAEPILKGFATEAKNRLERAQRYES